MQRQVAQRWIMEIKGKINGNDSGQTPPLSRSPQSSFVMIALPRTHYVTEIKTHQKHKTRKIRDEEWMNDGWKDWIKKENGSSPHCWSLHHPPSPSPSPSLSLWGCLPDTVQSAGRRGSQSGGWYRESGIEEEEEDDKGLPSSSPSSPSHNALLLRLKADWPGY